MFYDTETSGLWRDDLAADDPAQPNLVQLGVKLFDANWNRAGSLVCLIKPDGWSIEPEAEAHHGISEARCSRFGVPLVSALAALAGFAANARTVVAHNNEFDRRIIRSSLSRVKASGLWWEKKAPAFFCTMEAMTDVCQLPGRFGGFKFPSLEEAHRFLFPATPYATQHDAEDDLEACVRIFKALEVRGKTPDLVPARGRA